MDKNKKAEEDIIFAVKKVNELGRYIGKYFFNNATNLFENATSLYDYDFPKIHLERQKDYKKIIFDKIQQLFTDAELKNFDLEQIKGLTLPTIDHHGILNHPALYSGNINSRFNELFIKKDKAIPIIALGCGICPLNDPFHRRGFQFQGKQVNMFSKYDQHRLIYATPLVEYDIITKLIKSKKHILFNQNELDFLKKINDIIANIDFSQCERYSDQIIKINYALWPLLFEEKLRKNLVDLIILEHEEIVTKFLLEFLQNEDTFIYQMMFGQKFRELILESFRGKYSAWEESRQYGTHFFWHIDKNGIQRHLYFNTDNELESGEGFRIKFTLEEIIRGMKERVIVPSMFLKFSTAICYLGIVPLAGIGSVNYLCTLKDTWAKIMPSEFSQEKELISKIKTDGLVTIPIGYEYDREKNKIVELYAFDVFYKGGFSQDYLEKVGKMRIDELLRPLLDFAYNYYMKLLPEKERVKIDFDQKTILQPFKRLFE